jgi:ComF family protein
LWYYDGSVRESVLDFKFRGIRSHARSYGRLLAMKLVREGLDDFDILSWVPVSPLRRWRRGYDQVELIARAVGEALGTQPKPLLKKVRHVPPQSGIAGAAERRANVLGAYKVPNPALVAGKRILLLDDIITTGATISECAKTLLAAGAKEIYGVAVAAARLHK